MSSATLAASGCRSDTTPSGTKSASTAGPPSSVMPSTTLPPASTTTGPGGPGIRRVDFRNHSYRLGADFDSRAVTASAGSLSWTDPELGEYRGSVDDPQFGDLDGDGLEEAVVVLRWSFSAGTGRFSDVLVFRMAGGQAAQVASAGTGDRADGGIHRVRIERGVLEIARYAGAAACCPDRVVVQDHHLAGSALVPSGPLRQRAMVNLDPRDASPAKEIRFLPGSDEAELNGDGSQRHTATFAARRVRRSRSTCRLPPGRSPGLCSRCCKTAG